MPPFNPLDTDSLTKVFTNELVSRQCVALPQLVATAVEGAGLYALYYAGDFEPYADVSLAGCEWPIYLGSALPPGSRTGNVRTVRKSPILERLERHKASIASTGNLSEDHFHARWFEVDEPFIILGEILLLRFYRPLWNSTLPGFGAKVVGGRRTGGRVSKWDTLHPGRRGMGTAPGNEISRIEAAIEAHLDTFPPQWSISSPGNAAATSGP
jgi:hypothetical protein